MSNITSYILKKGCVILQFFLIVSSIVCYYSMHNKNCVYLLRSLSLAQYMKQKLQHNTTTYLQTYELNMLGKLTIRHENILEL